MEAIEFAEFSMPEIEFDDLNTDDLPTVLQIWIDKDNVPIVNVSAHDLFDALADEAGTINGDPGPWGVILADTIRHIAKAHHEALGRLEGPEVPSEDRIYARIMQVLGVELLGEDPENESATTLPNPEPD